MDAPAAPRRSSEHRFLVGAAGLGLLLLLAIALLLEPDPRGYGTHERLGFAPCMPMEAWGVPCPGCGITTSVTHAVRGELGASLRTQPFGLVFVLACLAFAAWALVGHLAGRDRWREMQRLPRPLLWRWGGVLGVLFALAWTYKLALVRGWWGLG